MADFGKLRGRAAHGGGFRREISPWLVLVRGAGGRWASSSPWPRLDPPLALAGALARTLDFVSPLAGSMVRTSRVLGVGRGLPRGAMLLAVGRRGSSSGILPGLLVPTNLWSARLHVEFVEVSPGGPQWCAGRGWHAEVDVFVGGIWAWGSPRGSTLPRGLHPGGSRPSVVVVGVRARLIGDDRRFGGGMDLRRG